MAQGKTLPHEDMKPGAPLFGLWGRGMEVLTTIWAWYFHLATPGSREVHCTPWVASAQIQQAVLVDQANNKDQNSTENELALGTRALTYKLGPSFAG